MLQEEHKKEGLKRQNQATHNKI